MIRSLRIWLAQHRLQRMIDAQRKSFACVDYRKRRAAALKHTRSAG